MPKLTCITTTYNDGEMALGAIQSVLAQSFRDFQYIIVDDGSTDATLDVLASLQDPRIEVIRQANDGLSSARNKAFPHIKGDYVCFLDSDDSRPNWSFAAIAEVIDRDAPDLVLCRGVLSDLRGDVTGFYDDSVFFQIGSLCPTGTVKRGEPDFMKVRPLAQRIEPQSANKAVRTAFLRSTGVQFPNGHFFEDMYFHTNLLAAAQSISFVMSPCFTYFRRYMRQQITATSGARRFDSIAVTKLTLETFARSLEFHDAATRTAVLISCLRIVEWCGQSIGHQYRATFRQTVKALLAMIDPLYLSFPAGLSDDIGPREQIERFVNAVQNAT